MRGRVDVYHVRTLDIDTTINNLYYNYTHESLCYLVTTGIDQMIIRYAGDIVQQYIMGLSRNAL